MSAHAPATVTPHGGSVAGPSDVPAARRRHWPHVLVTVLAVVAAVGGAATVLALRSARQAPSAAAASHISTGYPPARSDAGMAFDSTSGVTVMYGGFSPYGSPLSDTWLWDGSSWSALIGSSPGPLTDVRMSDDTADGGVLMVGVPQSPPWNDGCSRPVPGVKPIDCSPIPAPMPTLATFLFRSDTWTLADSGPPPGPYSPTTPSSNDPAIGSELAFDSITGQVVAVSATYHLTCAPQLPCPLVATGPTSIATWTCTGPHPQVLRVAAIPLISGSAFFMPPYAALPGSVGPFLVTSYGQLQQLAQ